MPTRNERIGILTEYKKRVDIHLASLNVSQNLIQILIENPQARFRFAEIRRIVRKDMTGTDLTEDEINAEVLRQIKLLKEERVMDRQDFPVINYGKGQYPGSMFYSGQELESSGLYDGTPIDICDSMIQNILHPELDAMEPLEHLEPVDV